MHELKLYLRSRIFNDVFQN